jgi:two-component system, NtrC family, response regulator AtoC
LRERIEEVPALAEYFIQRYSKLLKRPWQAFAPPAMDRLMKHSYPGNVRELENVVKRMIVLNDPLLTRIPLAGATSDNGGGAATEAPGGLKEIGRTAARAAEREAIERTLRQTNWNRVKAAKLLRISYRALLYKIKDARL